MRLHQAVAPHHSLGPHALLHDARVRLVIDSSKSTSPFQEKLLNCDKPLSLHEIKQTPSYTS